MSFHTAIKEKTTSYRHEKKEDIQCDRNTFRIGSRIVIAGRHLATIRFLGQVHGQDGEWVGLEWDDPSRGKHDGMYDGVRYFECQRNTASHGRCEEDNTHAGPGSLIRLRKLIQNAETGISLEKAIDERYKYSVRRECKNDMIKEEEKDPDIVGACTGVAHNTVQAVLVGEEKSEHIARSDGRLMQVSCAAMFVSDITPTLRLQSFLRKVEYLDLSSNLLCRWSEVLRLIDSLPALKTLDVSDNKMELDKDEGKKLGDTKLQGRQEDRLIESSRDQDCSLESLILNRCALTWYTALQFARSLPSIKFLYLCENDIDNMKSVNREEVLKSLSGLRLLDLSRNQLSDWKEVSATLGNLDRLQTLLLTQNNFSEISYSQEHAFPHLKQLGLGSNNINSWESVNQLHLFPALEELRLSKNPIISEDPAARRYDIIVRLGRLQVLNGGTISASERRDAELDYLRRSVQLVNTVGPSSEDTHRKPTPHDESQRGNLEESQSCPPIHPSRLALLLQQYKDFVESVKRGEHASVVNGKLKTLESSTVELILMSGSKSMRKKIPRTLTVSRLKPLLEKLFRIKLSDQTLLLIPSENTGRDPEDITNENTKELGYFAVDNGWRIQVVSEDTSTRMAKKKQERYRDFAEAQHEATLQRLRNEEEKLMKLEFHGVH